MCSLFRTVCTTIFYSFGWEDFLITSVSINHWWWSLDLMRHAPWTLNSRGSRSQQSDYPSGGRIHLISAYGQYQPLLICSCIHVVWKRSLSLNSSFVLSSGNDGQLCTAAPRFPHLSGWSRCHCSRYFHGWVEEGGSRQTPRLWGLMDDLQRHWENNLWNSPVSAEAVK